MNENRLIRPDRRHRGTHSTACKCPAPVYIRPAHYKPLSREHGRALRNLMRRDSTGQWHLRRRVSADPLFVFLRPHAGRRRAFRPERRQLLDALFVLFINTVDLATGIVTLNVSRLAAELSPRDSAGHLIPSRAVTVSRVSRLIRDLARFGVIEAPACEWDTQQGWRLPRHVIITPAGWRLTGVDMNRLHAEQEARLQALERGILLPGELMTLKAARRRWYDRCRQLTLLHRHGRRAEVRLRHRLAELPFDERKRLVAERLFRQLKDQRPLLTPEAFEKQVRAQLHRVGLTEPPTGTDAT